MKILYIGAGLHVEVFQHISMQELVCIDVLPRTEFGSLEVENGISTKFYRKSFYNELVQKINNMGFTLKSKTIFPTNHHDCLPDSKLSDVLPALLVFENILGNVIKYFISTNYKLMKDLNESVICNTIKQELSNVDGMILCGHDPQIDYYELLSPIVYYCYNSTYYLRDEFDDSDETFFGALRKEGRRKFIVLDYDSGKILAECSSLQEVSKI